MRPRRSSTFFLSWVAAFAVLPWTLAQTEAPLNRVVPLASTTEAGSTSGIAALTASAAQRAHELGFPVTAAELYRVALADPGADRAALTLGLATALLDEGRAAEAEKVLNEFVGLRGSAWQLRAGLAALALRKMEAAGAAVAAVKETELTEGDRAWWFFAQALLAGAAGDVKATNKAFEQAQAAAGSDLVRTRFRLEEEWSLLRRSGSGNEAQLAEQRLAMERSAGQALGFLAARGYAANLNALGRKAQAIEVIKQQLLILPRDERQYSDDFRLWLGLIAGAGEGEGRVALSELVATGKDPVRQRMALRLLAQASEKNPARGQLRAELGRLIALVPAHPLQEDFYLYRASLLLGDKSYAAAENDARALLEKFPGSGLKAEALAVLTGAAWEQRRYRLAADSATRAAAAMAAGTRRAELGVLVAEAWFRAQDFRSAADAYAAVLRDPPANLTGVRLSELKFQRVQAEIEAGALDAASTALDGLVREPEFRAEERWKAEWNLARALQARGAGGAAAAFERVERLLGGEVDPGLSADLRARLEWLRARLTLDISPPQPAKTLDYLVILEKTLAGVSPAMGKEIASSAAVVKAQAFFRQKNEAAALEQLRKLRVEFPESEAAVSSYLEEADHYVKQFKLVEAQQLYTKLADDFPKNINAPYALYFAALQAEARGEANLAEANRLIEDLVKRYPQSDLIFAARLKQGHLLRKLNQFPQAQQAYEDLVNNFAARPDVVLAQLALALTHNAQAASDPSHQESALALLENLRDRVDAPVDVRVEAGFNLGAVLKQRGEAEKAATVWWRDVVMAFLIEPKMKAQLGSKGPYWIAKTLLEFGALRERQGNLEEAKKAWLLLLKSGLPGAGQATEKLAAYGVPAPAQ